MLDLYPHLSQTYVLTEILALEAQGQDLAIFSLRPPTHVHVHRRLAQVSSPISYLPSCERAADLWLQLGRAHRDLGDDLARHLGELVAAPPDTAAQAVELAVRVRRLALDHLHAHGAAAATTVARLGALLGGVTYSLTAHPDDLFPAAVDPLELRRKLRDAAAVVTLSDHARDFLRRRYGPAAEKVVRIHQGVDPDDYVLSAWQPRPPVAVAVGRLVPKRGFDVVVSAVHMLIEEGRPVRLQVIGEGEDEGALRAQVDAAGLADAVQFCGALPPHRTREAIRAAAVLVAPSVVAADGSRDEMPMAVLEALALGTPVVASSVGGIPEVVRHSETGLLVRPGNAAALAIAIRRLLDDPHLAGRLAAAGRRRIEESFDAGTNTRLLAAMFSGIVAGRPGVGA